MPKHPTSYSLRAETTLDVSPWQLRDRNRNTCFWVDACYLGTWTLTLVLQVHKQYLLWALTYIAMTYFGLLGAPGLGTAVGLGSQGLADVKAKES